jgi:hypothetical protein
MKRIITNLCFLALAIIFFPNLSYSNPSGSSDKIYGVTLDAVGNLNRIVTSLSNHNVKPTTRIVFDEWQPATNYSNAVNQIHNVSFIMGEIIDSYYMHEYTVNQYKNRVKEYLGVLGDKVDIWEIGNEINGEWLGSTQSVINKISYAFDTLSSAGKKTAITLYYNKNCWENPQNEMFRWAHENIPERIKNKINFVFVSYYEDDCNNYQPDWQQVFDSLHMMFPNSKIGIGECGTRIDSRKEEYINRYYTMSITTPNYVGGYFWWYYKKDCVPWTKSLWTVLNNAMCPSIGIKSEEKDVSVNNYPNPFNPETRIEFGIDKPSFVKIRIFNSLGQEVAELVNEKLNSGRHSYKWNGSEFSSGVYFYELVTDYYKTTKRMMLLK